MLRKLQTTGASALGKLEESKDKRAEVVEWCGTGIEILSKYLNPNEKAKLFSQLTKATLKSEQPQEKLWCQSFGERLQQISLWLAADV